MIRRPPRSTLFPTRRSSDLFGVAARRADEGEPSFQVAPLVQEQLGDQRPKRGRRSEEHTSELQSRLHLVCRLLLEKKKKHQGTPTVSTQQNDLHTTYRDCES